MHKSDTSLYLLLKSVYSCVSVKKKEKKGLYASKILHINNTVFELSVQLDLTFEFTMFQILEHSACLPKYFGSDLIPCKAA